MENKNNEIPTYMFLISIIITFILGFYTNKLLSQPKKESFSNFDNFKINVSEDDEKINEYESCLENSRYHVEEALSILENPEDYDNCYEVIEEALSNLEETDFCGL